MTIAQAPTREYADIEHDARTLHSAAEAEKAVQESTSVVSALCTSQNPPHSLFSVTAERYWGEDGKANVVVGANIHGCSDCLLQSVARTLANRLRPEDFAMFMFKAMEYFELRQNRERMN